MKMPCKILQGIFFTSSFSKNISSIWKIMKTAIIHKMLFIKRILLWHED